jgi:hypothetical protein
VSLVVIAVLAIIWVVALTPMMLRKLSERRFTTSVDSFHRQLRGMRLAYPRLAATAAAPEAMLFATEMVDDDDTRASSATPAHLSRSEAVDRHARPAPLPAARRRRVLLVLGTAMLGFFVLGMIPALRVLWGLSLLAFAAAAGYLALLIYMHRRAVERKAKVVDIRDLRHEASRAVPVTAAVPVVVGVRRRDWDEADFGEDDFGEDDLADPAFDYDYDEIMAGGR